MIQTTFKIIKTTVFIPKHLLQGIILPVKFSEPVYKEQGIRRLESPMLEPGQSFQILFRMIENKIMGRLIHQRQQFIAFRDDGLPQSPGKHSRKKSCDFNILSFGKPVRDGYGISRDKIRTFKFSGLPVEKILYFLPF